MLLNLPILTLVILASAVVINDAAFIPGKFFDRVFIIMFENEGYTTVMNNAIFAAYAKQGVSFTNFYALAHPSQPNYIAQIGASTLNVRSDANVDLPQTNLVDLLEAKGVSWISYNEDYPGNCFAGATSGLYARKHTPFISFNDIRENATRCAKIVNSDKFTADLAAGTIPQFAYYTPNLENDGHNTGTAYAANWLKGFLDPKLSNKNFVNGTAIVLTWDEDNLLQGNHIYTVLLGSAVKVGVADNTRYTHYSLTKTIEDNWQLGTLNREDATSATWAQTNFVARER